MYIIRLDDASEKMNSINWKKMEKILDYYNIKPIVGIIPNNKDTMFEKFDFNKNFWEIAKNWENKGWIIAMHGYEHLYVTKCAGINPVHNRSEFAGLSLVEQKRKIKAGYDILLNKGLHPTAFFAPSHTFDNNTLEAIKCNSDIRIISDTIAYNIYYYKDLYFIPQQSGKVRKLPLKTVTFCYHPNEMKEEDFVKFEVFIKKNKRKFKKFKLVKREKNIFDILLTKIYFMIQRIKRRGKKDY